MSAVSRKLRRWAADGQAGYRYWCQGCGGPHSIRTEGPGSWGFNGDVERPVFTPSVLLTSTRFTAKGQEDFDAWHEAGMPARNGLKFDSEPYVCHSFVGCNGAQPGEVIFLGDCTHALAGTVQPLPDLPDYLRGEE